jgi:hypothetical protein
MIQESDIIDRTLAVHEISQRLGKETIALVSPIDLPFAYLTTKLPKGWVAYIDRGDDVILRVDGWSNQTDRLFMYLATIGENIGDLQTTVLFVPDTAQVRSIIQEQLKEPLEIGSTAFAINLGEILPGFVSWPKIYVEAVALIDPGWAQEVIDAAVECPHCLLEKAGQDIVAEAEGFLKEK